VFVVVGNPANLELNAVMFELVVELRTVDEVVADVEVLVVVADVEVLVVVDVVVFADVVDASFGTVVFELLVVFVVADIVFLVLVVFEVVVVLVVVVFASCNGPSCRSLRWLERESTADKRRSTIDFKGSDQLMPPPISPISKSSSMKAMSDTVA